MDRCAALTPGMIPEASQARLAATAAAAQAAPAARVRSTLLSGTNRARERTGTAVRCGGAQGRWARPWLSKGGTGGRGQAAARPAWADSTRAAVAAMITGVRTASTLRHQAAGPVPGHGPRLPATAPAWEHGRMDGALRHETDGVIRRLKVCLNGKRSQADCAAVPVTPAELARDAAAAVAAGAEAIHLHARGPDGAESVRPDDVGAAVAAVRAACPGTPVGVSTGLWITRGDARARHAAVAGWSRLDAAARPDFASVNVCEEGWAGVARVLGKAAIGVEAGVWSAADVPVLAAAAAGLPQPPLRILVEVMGEPAPRPRGRPRPSCAPWTPPR